MEDANTHHYFYSAHLQCIAQLMSRRRNYLIKQLATYACLWSPSPIHHQCAAIKSLLPTSHESLIVCITLIRVSDRIFDRSLHSLLFGSSEIQIEYSIDCLICHYWARQRLISNIRSIGRFIRRCLAQQQRVTMAGMMTAGKTVIVNDTKQVLSMRVGNHRHFADLATVQQGAAYTMDVDFNGTYREFQFTGVEGRDRGDQNQNQNRRSNHDKLIVSSDECCDYSCITVKEVDDSGKLGVQKEPRKKPSSSSSSSSSSQMTLASDTIPSKPKKSLLMSIWSWTKFWR